VTIPSDQKLSAAETKERADARKRSADHLWSGGEDLLLKALCDRYPSNWRLICDSFNAAQQPAPHDRRSLWDCVERWRLKWGPSMQQAQAVPEPGAPTPAAGTESASAMTTRGARRVPSGTGSASVSGNGSLRPAAIVTTASVTADDARKRKHHLTVYDTVKKAMRKREHDRKQAGVYPGPSVFPHTDHAAQRRRRSARGTTCTTRTRSSRRCRT
jgi:hypothetical protein